MLLLDALAGWRLKKEASVVEIVQDQEPICVLPVFKPVANELENVGFRVAPIEDLEASRNISEALLKPRHVASVYPQNPCFGRLFSKLIAIFDGKLRFS